MHKALQQSIHIYSPIKDYVTIIQEYLYHYMQNPLLQYYHFYSIILDYVPNILEYRYSIKLISLQ